MVWCVRYGNPDGPSSMKVGIGLPRFILAEENQLVILVVFFLILLLIVPGLFIWYYQNQRIYAANGVMLDTLQFLRDA